MADPYIGEIRMWGGNFAPAGWAFCNGALLAISDYEALFNLIGTTYGGDGETNFALPNLQGRLPMHVGQGFPIASLGGSETVTLTGNQLPIHNHAFLASQNNGTATSPAGQVPATLQAGSFAYLQAPATSALNPASLLPDPGGSQPHENRQPFLCISFILSLFGIYPTPT
jgi:microcystin-dependent protein